MRCYMKTNKINVKLAIVIILGAALVRAEAQGFINLGFESATLVPIPGDPYGRVQFAQAFPGWTATVGGFPLTNALYNNYFLDTAGMAIIDRGWSNQALGFPRPVGLIDGNYTAVLFSGTFTNIRTGADTSLSQTGLVPAGTESLEFKAQEVFDSSGSLVVTLGGQTLSLVTLGSGPNYTLYGADIGNWAGHEAQLSFTVPGETPHMNDEYVFLDSIEFLSNPIPEPRALAVVSVGAVMFVCYRWRRKR
jgi:hypothetical protein